jgi:2-hydroxy-3-keto-5-methylthiopentenyl-1-phosphate phosphatase
VRHFVHELNNFKAKITESKHDTYEAAKESDHDDLVMSMGMGVWYINRVYGEKLEYSEKLTGNIEYDVLNYGIR